jgi:hypothetical protein
MFIVNFVFILFCVVFINKHLASTTKGKSIRDIDKFSKKEKAYLNGIVSLCKSVSTSTGLQNDFAPGIPGTFSGTSGSSDFKVMGGKRLAGPTG